MPFTAVFGRVFLPVLGKFFGIETSTRILSGVLLGDALSRDASGKQMRKMTAKNTPQH
ncbi:MAG: hypothetical protein HYX68_16670 [Planctomycetes bacterium]|nr:hypothetical protein [Planctomycetota bacterium]